MAFRFAVLPYISEAAHKGCIRCKCHVVRAGNGSATCDLALDSGRQSEGKGKTLSDVCDREAAHSVYGGFGGSE